MKSVEYMDDREAANLPALMTIEMSLESTLALKAHFVSAKLANLAENMAAPCSPERSTR